MEIYKLNVFDNEMKIGAQGIHNILKFQLKHGENYKKQMDDIFRGESPLYLHQKTGSIINLHDDLNEIPGINYTKMEVISRGKDSLDQVIKDLKNGLSDNFEIKRAS